MTAALDPIQFRNFDEAARAALAFLHQRLGFSLWMVTRTQGDDCIVLQSESHGYDVRDGTVLSWADSFCVRMVNGEGPCIAPRSRDVPAYASAPICAQAGIEAYIGVPLKGIDGKLFGTLCAIDPHVQPESIVKDLALVEMIGGLLSTLLRTEMQFAEETRRAERAQLEALSDGLTGLFNRRGWQRLLDGEEQRCRRHGHSAAIVSVDVDDLKRVNDERGHFAGDEILSRVGSALTGVMRNQDVAARVGGDEFALMAVECDVAGARALVHRLRHALDLAGVHASIGMEMRDPVYGLVTTWEQADAAMYREKSATKSGLTIQLMS